MRERKSLPRGKIDKRLIYPIDELRVKFWLSKLTQETACVTNYALAKEFGVTQTKWKNYRNGGQPNVDMLTAVEDRVQGSKLWYTCGPNDMKLWISLASDISLNDLTLIASVSKNVDGKIAKFRIDAINGEIVSRECAYPNNIDDAFDNRVSDIKNDLNKLMNAELVQDAIEILIAIVQPQIDDMYKKSKEDLYDFIMPSKYKRSDYIEMIQADEYEQLELSTVKTKGKRKENN